jgi:hypothetical protein
MMGTATITNNVTQIPSTGGGCPVEPKSALASTAITAITIDPMNTSQKISQIVRRANLSDGDNGPEVSHHGM